jgi:hypothetical protein
VVRQEILTRCPFSVEDKDEGQVSSEVYVVTRRFMWSLGYTGSLGVSSIVQSGGLVLFLEAAFFCVTERM